VNSGYSQLNNWFISNQNFQDSPKLNYRLPTDLLPFHYDVLSTFQFINVVNNGFPYTGETTISFSCKQTTSSLIFHINKLDIDNSSLSLKSLTDSNFNELKAFNWYNDFTRHFFIANLTSQLKAGHNYTLTVKYVGYLTDDNAGFYRSSYKNDNNETVWLMTSQLESTDARKSFPCFDEPAMKATFKLSAIHSNYYNALSNMPVGNRTEL
jgi:aminopeptidase N